MDCIKRRKPIVILVADDDADDQLLIREAFEAIPLDADLRSVADGQELLDYLRNLGGDTDSNAPLRPNLILLDLNMPRKDGREALREIKSNPDLRNIPVIILTTSQENEGIRKCYEMGANSYITKPTTFEGLIRVLRTLGSYWFEVVELPVGRARC